MDVTFVLLDLYTLFLTFFLLPHKYGMRRGSYGQMSEARGNRVWTARGHIGIKYTRGQFVHGLTNTYEDLPWNLNSLLENLM